MKNYLVLMLVCASAFACAGERVTLKDALNDFEDCDSFIQERIAALETAGNDPEKLGRLKKQLVILRANVCELKMFAPNTVLEGEAKAVVLDLLKHPLPRENKKN